MGFLLYFNVSLQYFSSPIPEMCLDLVWSSLRSLFRRQIDTSIISPNEEPLHVFVCLWGEKKSSIFDFSVLYVSHFLTRPQHKLPTLSYHLLPFFIITRESRVESSNQITAGRFIYYQEAQARIVRHSPFESGEENARHSRLSVVMPRNYGSRKDASGALFGKVPRR
jgi:hypothetical protein